MQSFVHYEQQELLENPREMFFRYFIHSGVCSEFKSSKLPGSLEGSFLCSGKISEGQE